MRSASLPIALLLLLAFAPAAAQPEAAPTSAPAPRDPACSEGMTQFLAGRPDEAEPRLAQCAEAVPAPLDALLALTQICLADGRGYDATAWAVRAVQEYPESADAHYFHGRALMAVDDPDAARETWEAGLALRAEHPGLLRELARLHLRVGDDAKAYGLLTQLVRVNGGDGWAHRALSELASRRALWRQALAHWRDALSFGPRDAGDLRRAGELAIMAGDTAYALRAGQGAVDTDDSAASYALLGEAQFAARDFVGAEAALRAALERDPGLASARFHLANALELLGRVEEAEGEFRRYTAQEPGDALGFYNFAVHLDKRGLLEEALLNAEQATALAPEMAGPRILRGRLLEKLGDDDGALQEAEAVMALPGIDPDGAAAWRNDIRARVASADSSAAAGLVKLMHLVTPDSMALAAAQADLRAGLDFGVVVTRYSVGPTAAQGGVIGWIDPSDMVGGLRKAIAALDVQEISPPVSSGGLFHIFKRIR